ncbi:DNA-binding protein [Streptomyces sp. NPDC001194]|uniref:DNA-binding protein n=1 Tax=Streptomyces sp. NPDC001194 TaxID=3364547 RepID=UPI0036A72BAA
MDRPQLVTAADAAYYTGRPIGTIWRWASEGRITVRGRGKAARYDLRELDRKTINPWTDEVRLGKPPKLPEGARAA